MSDKMRIIKKWERINGGDPAWRYARIDCEWWPEPYGPERVIHPSKLKVPEYARGLPIVVENRKERIHDVTLSGGIWVAKLENIALDKWVYTSDRCDQASCIMPKKPSGSAGKFWSWKMPGLGDVITVYDTDGQGYRETVEFSSLKEHLYAIHESISDFWAKPEDYVLAKLLPRNAVTAKKGVRRVQEPAAKSTKSNNGHRQHKSKLYLRQEGACAGCDEWFDYENLEVDHINANPSHDRDDPINLQLLCRSCNASKGDRGMDSLFEKLS